jgi:peptidoglycan/LPS O-acetylase OafA/YrhL
VAALALYVLVARLFPSASVRVRGIFFQTAWGGLGVHVGFGLIAALLVAPAVFVREGSVPARVLRWRVLAWLGLISYGIYLWHDPLLGKLLEHGVYSWWPHHQFLVLTPATIIVAVAAAAASYYVLERPILALKNVTPARRAGSAAPARRALH